MPEAVLTRIERDALVEKMRDIDEKHYPKDKSKEPSSKESQRLDKLYYATMGEYFHRLPRPVLSKCPHCGKPFRHSFDPYGLDGPWWWTDRFCTVKEPQDCGHFRVLQGAYALRGRDPKEVKEGVEPGPAVPFVVPRLLRLPKMVAVIGKLAMANGDVAYPMVYFSTAKIPADDLYKEWGRNEYWFKDEKGHSCWTIPNSKWDFELKPYLENGAVRFVDLKGGKSASFLSGKKCASFLGLEGERSPQVISWGELAHGELPNGEIICPFED